MPITVQGHRGMKGRSAPLLVPTWISDADLYEWVAVPTTNAIADVAYSPSPGGSDGPSSVVNGWGSIAVDHSTCIAYMWGGGHGNYAGNEVYSLSLNTATPAWGRVNDPYTPVDTDLKYYATNQPSARHTYTSLWVASGKLKCTGGAYVYGSSSVSPSDMDQFDLTAETWAQINNNGANWITCGDPATGDVYCVGTGEYVTSTWRKLSANNTWSELGSGDYGPGDYGGAAFDSARSRIYRIGSYDGNRRVDYWEIGTGDVDPSLSGDAATNFDTAGSYTGVDYDSQNDWILLKSGTGATVYRMDCDTLACDTLSTSGTVTNAFNGVNGRFRYIPTLKGFIYVPQWGSAYFLRTG